MRKALHAALRVTVIGHGGGNAGRAGGIGIEEDLEPAHGRLIDPDLGLAIDPEHRRLAEIGAQDLRRGADEGLLADRSIRRQSRG